MSTGTMSRPAVAPTIPHIARCPSRPSLAFGWPLPDIDSLLPGARQRQLAGRRGLSDGRSGADGGVRPNAHRRHQHGAGADKCARPYRGAMLVGPIVIARDGPGANVGRFSNLGIA